MAVRIFCDCGKEITHEISLWDRKTRSVFWMEQNPPSCAICRKQQAPSRTSGDTGVRRKVAVQ